MAKQRVVQKIVSFDSKKKGLSEIEKELVDGWYVASIVPHKSSYLCVLERVVGENPNGPSTANIKDILSSTKSSRTRKRLLQDA